MESTQPSWPSGPAPISFTQLGWTDCSAEVTIGTLPANVALLIGTGDWSQVDGFAASEGGPDHVRLDFAGESSQAFCGYGDQAAWHCDVTLLAGSYIAELYLNISGPIPRDDAYDLITDVATAVADRLGGLEPPHAGWIPEQDPTNAWTTSCRTIDVAPATAATGIDLGSIGVIGAGDGPRMFFLAQNITGELACTWEASAARINGQVLPGGAWAVGGERSAALGAPIAVTGADEAWIAMEETRVIVHAVAGATLVRVDYSPNTMVEDYGIDPDPQATAVRFAEYLIAEPQA